MEERFHQARESLGRVEGIAPADPSYPYPSCRLATARSQRSGWRWGGIIASLGARDAGGRYELFWLLCEGMRLGVNEVGNTAEAKRRHVYIHAVNA